MSQAVPFQILHDLAQKAMDEAFKAIGQAMARQRSAEEQLIKLQEYRHDYLRNLQQAMHDGITSSQCQNTQRFISTLDDAIAKQSGVLGQIQKQVAQARERWMTERRKVASMQALIERDAKRQILVQAKLEQKANDEYAARSHRRLQLA
ncbi:MULTISPECIES: flagellar export protein FliJ [unclassified Bordetella]|uniref:flagellar export protein FliJ n=1 Tax=unclassified Bordetella TaxID=2630031 RepID=UPI001321CC0C|nr:MULTISPECIES: flagellar export protein FliJ [unclassified Bordetella]MVW69957.1 flagellar export protein FliJ [Bordetella sp. 15P40C-2]MVW78171.1 flagellar export protein FliJ [Bordetella sp. 02P26C-1]